jgi:hypothetical protein
VYGHDCIVRKTVLSQELGSDKVCKIMCIHTEMDLGHRFIGKTANRVTEVFS